MNRLLAILALVALVSPASVVGQSGDNDPSNETEHPASNDEIDGADNDGDNHTDNETAASDDDVPDDDQSDDGSDDDRDNDRDDDADDDADEEDDVEIDEDEDGFEARGRDSDSHRPRVRVDAKSAKTSVSRPGVPSLETQVESVIEHLDENGDGAYNLGERVLARHHLRDIVPTIISDPAQSTLRDVSYPLAPTGMLTLRFDMAAGAGAKFDVIINGYTFADPGSRLAVANAVEVDGGIRATTVEGHPAVASAAKERTSFMSWIETVQVDGRDDDVGWSLLVGTAESGKTAYLYWSYAQGQNIVHDPLVGVATIPFDKLGDVPVFVVALAAAGAVMAVGFEVRRRMRV